MSKAAPRYHVYLQRRSRNSRERLFNAGLAGNQPNLPLVNLDTYFPDERAQHD